MEQGLGAPPVLLIHCSIVRGWLGRAAVDTIRAAMPVGYVYDPIYRSMTWRDTRSRRGCGRSCRTWSRAACWGGWPRCRPGCDGRRAGEGTLTGSWWSVRAAADPYRDHWLDVDTYVVGKSYEAALRSAGGVMAAADAVLDGDARSAFCLCGRRGTTRHRGRRWGSACSTTSRLRRRTYLRRGAEPSCDHRLRRAPRQWDAGHLLPRRARAVFLDAPAPVLPGDGVLQRDGRGRRARRAIGTCRCLREQATRRTCGPIARFACRSCAGSGRR